MKTLIGIVLDESSSMWCRQMEVINGFNKFIETQKTIKDDSARLFMVKFNSTVTVVYSGIPLEEVTPLTQNNYHPNACTALYDAIAKCVQIMDGEKTPEERAICVIMTDGEENSSVNTTLENVRHIIKTHEQQNDWTFIYIGVEIAEWMKRSGMRSTHCSTGFSTPTTAQRSTSRARVQLQNLGLIYPGIPRATNYARVMPSLEDYGDSEEMDTLNSAISDYRSSRHTTSDDPFKRRK